MSTTTLPLRIKKEHLPSDVITSTASILDDLTRSCVEMYEKNLATRGKWLTSGDREQLVRYMKAEAKMALTLSVEVNEKKMDEDWMIYPKEESQTTFETYSGNPDVTLSFPSGKVIHTDLETMGQAASIVKGMSREEIEAAGYADERRRRMEEDES